MSDAALLNVVLFLPLLGTGLLVAAPAGERVLVRRLALVVMVAQFVLAAWLYARFDSTRAGLQFETRLPWIADWGVYYQIGLDGYNVLLVMLTAFLGPLVVGGAFTAIARGSAAVFGRLQTGSLHLYAWFVLLGIVGALLWGWRHV